VLLAGCQPVLSADTFKLVKLPADITTGPALVGVQTKEGRIFVTPLSGGFLRLSADGGTWDELPAPAMQRFVPDFEEGLSLAQGENATGFFRASGENFVRFDPPVPALGNPAFAGVGWGAVLGRDATGVFWATAAPTLGAIEGRVFVAHLDPAAPGDWQYDEVPYTTQRQAIAAAKPAMTTDSRFFFRPIESGLWEIDLPNHVLVERVACDHELFRPSRPELMPCQEDTAVFAGRDGVLFLLNPNRELWRISARGTSPTLVVKGALPKLDLASHRFVGAPQTYVDPSGRVWLAFRWGENVDADTSWLYVAEPAKRDAWTFLKADLPRIITLFGDGTSPLLSSGAQNTGLLVFRVAE
jgi:hypothetical protein